MLLVSFTMGIVDALFNHSLNFEIKFARSFLSSEFYFDFLVMSMNGFITSFIVRG